MEDEDVLELLLAAEAEIEKEAKKLNEDLKVESRSAINEISFVDNITSESKPQNGFSDLLNESLRREDLSLKNSASVVHSGEHDSSDDEDIINFLERKYNEYGRDINTIIKQKNQEKIDENVSKTVEASISKAAKRTTPALPEPHKFPVYNTPSPSNETKNIGIYTDPMFGIRIIHPLISSTMLQERMTNRTAVSTAGIDNHIKHNDLTKEWVLAGAILSKGPVSTSKNGSQYAIWKLSDLRGDVQKFSMFLFKSACKELWKTAVGMVIAILNPRIMDNKDNAYVACLAIDSAQKVMILGQSKDLGQCKSKKKNGETCNAVVNMNTCEFCIYHVKQEYGKMSGRSELQSATSGRGLEKLRNKVLGKSEVFYGGQLFTAIPAKKNPKLVVKDQKRLLTLSEYYQSPNGFNGAVSGNKKTVIPYASQSSVVSKVASVVESSVKQRQQDIERLKQLSGKDATDFNTNSDTKIVNVSTESCKNNVETVSTPEATPQLKKEGFSFELTVSVNNRSNISKSRALEILKKKPLEKANPNFIKYRGTEQGKKRALEEIDRQNGNDTKKRKITDEADQFRSERIKKIMEATSSHTQLIDDYRTNQEDQYFNKLERKEAMEEKMLNTFKVNCKAVICTKCKYSAFSAADRCKDERHPLKVIDAEKRFYKCLDCGNRTATLYRIPKLSCNNCHSSRWERTAMIRDRKTTQFGDGLSIRGDEETFLGSLKASGNVNLCVADD